MMTLRRVIGILPFLLATLIMNESRAQETVDQADGSQTLSKQAATAAGGDVHRRASQVDEQPHFRLTWTVAGGSVKTMQSVKGCSIDQLKHALDQPWDEPDLQRRRHLFAWGPDQFIYRTEWLRLSDSWNVSEPGVRAFFGTSDACWDRTQLDGAKPPRFVVRPGVAAMWEAVVGPENDYLRFTSHDFWWGDNSSPKHGFERFPYRFADYTALPNEQFGGEECRVVQSRARWERLWISAKTGRLRGYLMLMPRKFLPWWKQESVAKVVGHQVESRRDFLEWWNAHVESLSSKELAAVLAARADYCFDRSAVRPSMLIEFSDYREIASGIWWPFCERRSRVWHVDSEKNTFRYRKTKRTVEVATTEPADLAKRWKAWLPQEGERVQDQRYEIPINYEFDADMTELERFDLVNSALLEKAKAKQQLKELLAPVEEMVGQPAPELPDDGWIGNRPDMQGTTHLIHFWATWCAPCKNDLPALKRIAKDETVIGIHPPGTPADEVRSFIDESELNYPSLLPAEGDTFAGYPVKMFPYCVLVGPNGRVLSHGRLSSLLDDWPVQDWPKN